MSYISIDLRIGSSSMHPITKAQVDLYDHLIKEIIGQDQKIERIGLPNSFNIEHRAYIHNPPPIIKSILQETKDNVKRNCDTMIFDFTSNYSFSIREPLLITLFDELSINNIFNCTKYIILMSELPGDKCASAEYLISATKTSPIEFFIVANSGECYRYKSGRVPDKSIINDYQSFIENIYGTNESRLNEKCIRRLGHFQSIYPETNEVICRIFSFYMHNCKDELFEKFNSWWEHHGEKKSAILFDLKNNSEFRNAIKAFGVAKNIDTFRIVDVVSQKALSKTVSKYNTCFIILDVVETGNTLKKYSSQLKALNINLNEKVVSAINKSNNRSTIESFKVYGFLARQRETSVKECPQCKLKLPITPDSNEVFNQIRAYDMMHMASKSKWENEPDNEVPKNNGSPLQQIPNFSNMLKKYGDWISYKIYNLLKSENCPDDWFIIHPREGDSDAISKGLLTLFDEKPTVIKIPRLHIDDALERNNSWDEILQKNSDEYWTEQLRALKGSIAIILDIFNASGSTALCIYELLNLLKIQTYCYTCLVDFDPTNTNTEDWVIPKFSLYDWFNPRQQKV